MEERIVQAVGVNDYLNRVYTDTSGQAIQFYVGYYATQRTGTSIHSPKHCLPGGGWVPVSAGILDLGLHPSKPLMANEYVIEKGRDSGLVIYWYQLRGRVVASEYWAKIWMVIDALNRNRTDGALVRIWVPMADGRESAHDHAVSFARLVYPQLSEFIPN